MLSLVVAVCSTVTVEPRPALAEVVAGACPLSSGGTAQPNEGATNYSLYLRPKGTIPAIMIFVDFSDAPRSETTGSLYDLIAPNAMAWYQEVSKERMALSITPKHKWYRMPSPSTAYGFDDALTFQEQRTYIANAVARSNPDLDFSPYKIIYVVSSDGAAIPVSPAFIGYPGDGVTVDGVEIRHGATFGNDIRLPRQDYGSHVLIHETGHIFGLPDLYEYGLPYWDLLRKVGGWDTMSWVAPGAYFLAWHQKKFGWLPPRQMLCVTSGQITQTIAPLEAHGGLKMIEIKTGPSAAYVIEVRQRIGQDAGLCDTGVLIYSVKASVANGLGPVRVQPAMAGNDQAMIESCGPRYNATFDLGAGEISTFSDSSRGVTVELLSTASGSYSVSITKA